MSTPEGSKRKPTTPKQVTANKGNAKHSTGPRTGAGKAESARNATTHGLYASTSFAIARGPFKEDPDEVAQYCENLVATLEPRNSVEFAQANLVAARYLLGVRLNRLTAAAINADSVDESAILRAFGLRPSAALDEQKFAIATVLHEITTRSYCDLPEDHTGPLSQQHPDITFEDLVVDLLDRTSRLDTFDLPDDEAGPWTTTEGRAIFIEVLRTGFPDLVEAQEYAASRLKHAQAAYHDSVTRNEDFVVQRILSNSIEQILRHQARLDRSLASALEVYDEMRLRPLLTDDHHDEEPRR
jgi:hypothetical protein